MSDSFYGVDYFNGSEANERMSELYENIDELDKDELGELQELKRISGMANDENYSVVRVESAGEFERLVNAVFEYLDVGSEVSGFVDCLIFDVEASISRMCRFYDCEEVDFDGRDYLFIPFDVTPFM